MRARFIWISKLITEHGLENVGKPYVKHIEKVLWEIRLKGRDGIARALYVTVKPKRVVVLRVFIKKLRKRPGKKLNWLLKEPKKLNYDQN